MWGTCSLTTQTSTFIAKSKDGTFQDLGRGKWSDTTLYIIELKDIWYDYAAQPTRKHRVLRSFLSKYEDRAGLILSSFLLLAVPTNRNTVIGQKSLSVVASLQQFAIELHYIFCGIHFKSLEPPPPNIFSSDLHDSQKWPIFISKRRISPKSGEFACLRQGWRC